VSHAPEHEEMLQALVAGEVQESAREARVHLESCSVCARKWAEMKRDIRSFGRTSARMRAAEQAMNAAEPEPPGTIGSVEAIVEARLRDEIARSRAGAVKGVHEKSDKSDVRRQRPKPWLWFAIAATILAGASIMWLDSRGRDRGDELMGPIGIAPRDIQPLADGGLLFARDGEIPADVRAEPEIQGRADASAAWGDVHVVSGSQESARAVKEGWIADAERVRSWPRELRWRILLRDPMGAPRGKSDWSRVFHSP
jgi:hypothetical protein